MSWPASAELPATDAFSQLTSTMRGFWSAVQFLTRVPVPGGAFQLGAAVPWLPVVGLLLGATVALVDIALRWLSPSWLLISTLDVVLLLGLSGALHADGLMDTCDAVFVHASAERRLEIMRDPRVGSFGVVGLVAVVAVKIASLNALVGGPRSLLLLMGPIVGRWCIVLAAKLFPYGRPGGSGEPIKSGASWQALVLASAPLAVALLAWPVGPLAIVVAIIAVLAIGGWLLRLLPGLTGDCYGALCEIAEAVMWLSAALLWSRLAA